MSCAPESVLQSGGQPEGLAPPPGSSSGPVGGPKRHKTDLGFPFQGDFTGASFNTQAYFSSNSRKQSRRQRFVRRLCEKHDFVSLQEMHSTLGREVASDPIPGISRFWSHGDRRTRGIALFVKTSFLNQFSEHSWIQVEEGRVGVLRLKGPRGFFDIWVVYLDATDPRARSKSIHAIASHMRPSDKVLSCIAGDFNFTEHAADRFSKSSGQLTGDNDTCNANTW